MTKFQPRLAGARPAPASQSAANLADDIIAAYEKARRDQGDADDPHDDREERGPPQQHGRMTAEGILAAMNRALGQ
jgi:hypothetical protein